MPRQPRAILIVVHGLAEHSGRYGPFIRYFVGQGFGVAIYDQRGHGQSGGERGHFEHFQDLLSDLAQFIQMTKEANPGVPVVLVGHSFGGQVALNFVVRYAKGLRGLALSSPNLGLKRRISWWQRLLGQQLHRYAPQWAYHHRMRGRDFTSDVESARAFEADDRICRAVTLHTLHEIAQNHEVVMALASRIHIPAFFMHAGTDRICDPEATRRFFRAVPVARKQLKIYDGLQHELFNETQRVQVFGDLEAWLTDLLAEERAALAGRTAGADETVSTTARTYSVGRGERWAGYPQG